MDPDSVCNVARTHFRLYRQMHTLHLAHKTHGVRFTHITHGERLAHTTHILRFLMSHLQMRMLRLMKCL